MLDTNDDQLPPALADAILSLRRDPTLDPHWRAELLRRARTRPAEGPRRLAVALPWAIAAGVVCVIGGGVVGRLSAPHELPLAVAQRSAGAPAAVARPAPGTLPVKFTLVAPNAVRVSIVGDFDQWNPTALPMKRSADGRVWEVDVQLPAGRYSYAFLIDGRLATDPSAPSSVGEDFGTPNSVLMVKGS